jgi:hypothetical protein
VSQNLLHEKWQKNADFGVFTPLNLPFRGGYSHKLLVVDKLGICGLLTHNIGENK